MLNDNFAIKNESRYCLLWFIHAWNILVDLNHKNLKLPFWNYIILNWKKYKKWSEKYNDENYYRKKILKFLKDADFPEEIKKKWLNFYKLKNVNLESYLEMLEMLKWEPFFWSEETLKIDTSKFQWKDFLKKISKFHHRILLQRMYKGLWSKERLKKCQNLTLLKKCQN